MRFGFGGIVWMCCFAASWSLEGARKLLKGSEEAKSFFFLSSTLEVILKIKPMNDYRLMFLVCFCPSGCDRAVKTIDWYIKSGQSGVGEVLFTQNRTQEGKLWKVWLPQGTLSEPFESDSGSVELGWWLLKASSVPKFDFFHVFFPWKCWYFVGKTHVLKGPSIPFLYSNSCFLFSHVFLQESFALWFAFSLKICILYAKL